MESASVQWAASVDPYCSSVSQQVRVHFFGTVGGTSHLLNWTLFLGSRSVPGCVTPRETVGGPRILLIRGHLELTKLFYAEFLC